MTDDNVREEIMSATYEALCEHGYTDLTAQNIADRTDKSKSLLFYHYDSKEDLVADFVEYLLERYDERVENSRDLPPVERLAAFVDWFLYSPDDEERASFHTALLELRTQAPYNERYREQLRKSDDKLRETLEEILETGMEEGQFEPHDPSETAALLIAALDGARIRQITIGRDAYLEQVRRGITDTFFAELLAEGVELPSEFGHDTHSTDDSADHSTDDSADHSTDDSADHSTDDSADDDGAFDSADGDGPE